MEDAFPVQKVVNFEGWFIRDSDDYGQRSASFHGVADYPAPSDPRRRPDPTYPIIQIREQADDVAVIREIYNKRIGELGTHWSRIGVTANRVYCVPIDSPIAFKHAKIKIGDIIDFYTTSDGVLKIPQWAHFKYAVEEFLEEAPALKFHPSRVRQFIDEHGVDQLHEME